MKPDLNLLSTPVVARRTVLRLLGHAGLLAGVGTPWALARAADTAAAPRLVVVMLRGALDGLAAVPAVGDPDWANLRPATVTTPTQSPAPLPLDKLFALHPALTHLHDWYQAGELLVLHAVASPYRERSHFDAQQLLESGGDKPFALSTGWLGRALQVQQQAAVALDTALPLGLRGADQAGTWSPGGAAADGAGLADFDERLARLYHANPAFNRAWELAMAQSRMLQGSATAPARGAGGLGLFQQAGRFLSAPNGPRVAWLDVEGWDTHTQQAPRLARLLADLDRSLDALKTELGPVWAQTTVCVMTEFGRTAAFNGTGGTDHGTGGMALLAGPAVAGGRVMTDWPGLQRTALLAGRDLRPTQDIRPLLGALVQRQLGLSSAQIARDILPGVKPLGAEVWRA
jgi:uncharacterized protein (DUF1501 family)